MYLRESVHVPNIELIRIRCVPRRHASLNLKASQPPDRSPEGLKDLASRLLDAKMECLRSTIDCIPALKQVSQLGFFVNLDVIFSFFALLRLQHFVSFSLCF